MDIDLADRVKDKELLGMATEMAAQSLNAVKDPELLTIPPRILPQVLSHPQAFYLSSEWLSELVARYDGPAPGNGAILIDQGGDPGWNRLGWLSAQPTGWGDLLARRCRVR